MRINSSNMSNRTIRKLMGRKETLLFSISTTTRSFNNAINPIYKEFKPNICCNFYSYNKIKSTSENHVMNCNVRQKQNYKLFHNLDRSHFTDGYVEQNKLESDIKVKRKSLFEEEMVKLKKKVAKEKRTHKIALYFLMLSLFGVFSFYESYNPEFFLYDIVLNFCLQYLDSELCHDIFIWMGKYNLLPQDTSHDNIYSVSEIKQLKFLNPFGVAAGFDKNGESIEALLKLGFSFIEIGTITPRSQEGNKKPRIFRDNETKSVINSCGFNNIGCDEVTENLKKFRMNQKKEKLLKKHIVGVSIGSNKDSKNILADLIYCTKRVGRYADYIAINVSSPNTPGLRDNQEANKLRKIIIGVKEEINKLNKNSANEKSLTEIKIKEDKRIIKNANKNNYEILNKRKLVPFVFNFKKENKDNIFDTSAVTKNLVPFLVDVLYCEEINSNDDANEDEDSKNFWQNTTKEKPLLFVKLSPDLSDSERKEIAKVLLEEEIDGMIISNTTIQDLDIKCFKDKKGGVSGSKLKDISTKMIFDMYSYTNKQIPIIASGGVLTGEDALQKIEAGASVCQLYTSLVFNGVKTAVQMKREFDNVLYRKGYYNLQAAIGVSHKDRVRSTRKK